MSLSALSAEPLAAPGRQDPERTRERRLRPVSAPSPRRRPKLAYALLAVAGAVIIGGAQMGISLAATQDSFVLADLTSQQRALALEKNALQEELTGLSSPQALATKAAAMGLVVAGSASYLRLSDGKVLGAGEGSGWTSTVDPNGPGKVGNSLLVVPKPPADADKPVNDSEQKSSLPPSLTDGLPTPQTH